MFSTKTAGQAELQAEAKSGPIPRKPILPLNLGVIPHLLCIFALIFCVGLVVTAWVGTMFKSTSTSTGSLPGQPWLFVVRRDFNSSDAVGGDTILEPRYGISPFQVCRWTFDGADMTEETVCTKVGWIVPSRLGDLEEMADLGLSM